MLDSGTRSRSPWFSEMNRRGTFPLGIAGPTFLVVPVQGLGRFRNLLEKPRSTRILLRNGVSGRGVGRRPVLSTMCDETDFAMPLPRARGPEHQWLPENPPCSEISMILECRFAMETFVLPTAPPARTSPSKCVSWNLIARMGSRPVADVSGPLMAQG